MGTDDLFHKRKAKKAGDLARSRARRAPYPKVLIVCEGEKTEPYYFKSLKDQYSLNSANVEICGGIYGDRPWFSQNNSTHVTSQSRNSAGVTILTP